MLKIMQKQEKIVNKLKQYWDRQYAIVYGHIKATFYHHVLRNWNCGMPDNFPSVLYRSWVKYNKNLNAPPHLSMT